MCVLGLRELKMTLLLDATTSNGLVLNNSTHNNRQVDDRAIKIVITKLINFYSIQVYLQHVLCTDRLVFCDAFQSCRTASWMVAPAFSYGRQQAVGT